MQTPPVVCGWFGQRKHFRLRHLLGRWNGADNCRDLVRQKQDRFSETHPFHMNEIVQCTLAADISAFPVPQAGLSADLKAVVAPQLELTPALTGHDIVRSVLHQKINSTDLLGRADLLLGHSRHTASPLIPRHHAVPLPYQCVPKQSRDAQSDHRLPCEHRWV